MKTEPVTQVEPIATSDVAKVFDVPGSVLYRVEAKTPAGTTEVFENVRAFTNSLQFLGNGEVHMEITGKARKVGVTRIPYPYHFMLGLDVLFAIKVNPMRTQSGDGLLTFGLNYDLFSEKWGLCVIAHVLNGQQVVFYASRAEWDRGHLGTQNRELQMFLSIPEERNFDIDLYALQAREETQKWIRAAKEVMARKG
jgi:hypothetical protein